MDGIDESVENQLGKSDVIINLRRSASIAISQAEMLEIIISPSACSLSMVAFAVLLNNLSPVTHQTNVCVSRTITEQLTNHLHQRDRWDYHI